MSKIVYYDTVADYSDRFHIELGKMLTKRNGYVGVNAEFMYSTAAQLDGRVLFSVLVIAREVTQPAAE